MTNKELLDTANAIANRRTELAQLTDWMFNNDNKVLFIERIVEISQQITRGMKPPTTCSESMNIPYYISKYGWNLKYPLSDIEWDVIVEQNLVAISCKITAIHQCEVDTSYIFTFNIDDEEYKKYLEILTIEAELRLAKNDHMKMEEAKKVLETEKAQLEYLIKKYYTNGKVE